MASERILSKEEIETALNERHSPEKQKLLSAGQVTIQCSVFTCTNWSRASASD